MAGELKQMWEEYAEIAGAPGGVEQREHDFYAGAHGMFAILEKASRNGPLQNYIKLQDSLRAEFEAYYGVVSE